MKFPSMIIFQPPVSRGAKDPVGFPEHASCVACRKACQTIIHATDSWRLRVLIKCNFPDHLKKREEKNLKKAENFIWFFWKCSLYAQQNYRADDGGKVISTRKLDDLPASNRLSALLKSSTSTTLCPVRIRRYPSRFPDHIEPALNFFLNNIFQKPICT